MAKEILNAETSLNGKKVRKSPVPANFDRIMQGALNLPLKERVDIKNALSSSIDKELEQLENTLKESRNIVNGAK